MLTEKVFMENSVWLKKVQDHQVDQRNLKVDGAPGGNLTLVNFYIAKSIWSVENRSKSETCPSEKVTGSQAHMNQYSNAQSLCMSLLI